MAAHQAEFSVSTCGHCDVVDITEQVTRAVAASGVRTGIVNVSGVGSTLGITTIEYESGCVADLQRALDKIAPPTTGYAHNEKWGDGNGYSHLRSALMGTARSYPIGGGALLLGTWQQIVLCDFDGHPRNRKIVVTITGE